MYCSEAGNSSTSRRPDRDAFEHFGHERYEDFFRFAYDAARRRGHAAAHHHRAASPGSAQPGYPADVQVARFIRFIVTEIFPGGRLPSIEMVVRHADRAGFTLTHRQSLQLHYAHALDLWAEALTAHRDGPSPSSRKRSTTATCTTLTGCANSFRVGLHRRESVHFAEVARVVTASLSNFVLSQVSAGPGCAAKSSWITDLFAMGFG